VRLLRASGQGRGTHRRKCKKHDEIRNESASHLAWELLETQDLWETATDPSDPSVFVHGNLSLLT